MAKKTKQKLTIDGQTNEPVVKEKRQVRSIDELLGRTENPYTSHSSSEEYEKKLKNMQMTDLERHATEMGILPRSNKQVLIGKLVQEYRKKSSGYFNTLQFKQIEPKNKEALLKALQGGR
jgi:serine kinase of HPr protein (carbohydrate metabolism regulator)